MRVLWPLDGMVVDAAHEITSFCTNSMVQNWRMRFRKRSVGTYCGRALAAVVAKLAVRPASWRLARPFARPMRGIEDGASGWGRLLETSSENPNMLRCNVAPAGKGPKTEIAGWHMGRRGSLVEKMRCAARKTERGEVMGSGPFKNALPYEPSTPLQRKTRWATIGDALIV